jgi:glycosyltransferase involved in cell wall biosynthesis
MPTLHVVMPIYDEGPTLVEIVRRVLEAPLPAGWAVDLTMVDDGSRPTAAALAAECARSHGDGVRLIVHPANRGKGAALMTGFDAVLARASDADAVLVQDADLEYDPADYRALVATLGDPAVGTEGLVLEGRHAGATSGSPRSRPPTGRRVTRRAWPVRSPWPW